MTRREKLIVLCGAAVMTVSGVAVANDGPPAHTSNVEPMVTACKLSPAGMQAAQAYQKVAEARAISPQDLIHTLCRK